MEGRRLDAGQRLFEALVGVFFQLENQTEGLSNRVNDILESAMEIFLWRSKIYLVSVLTRNLDDFQFTKDNEAAAVYSLFSQALQYILLSIRCSDEFFFRPYKRQMTEQQAQ